MLPANVQDFKIPYNKQNPVAITVSLNTLKFCLGSVAITMKTLILTTYYRSMSDTSKNERLRAIIETIVDGIITINDVGIMETVNPATESIFGYSAREMIGQNVSMLMPEPHRSHHDQYLANYMRTGIAKVIGIGKELFGQRKNGEVFAMELAINEMNVNGNKMFTGIVRDISARKLIENHVINSEAKLRAVFDTVLDSIITINKNGIIESANSATESIFGYQVEELIGKNVNVLMPEPYTIEHDSYIQNYLDSGTKKVIGMGREVIGKRKNGSVFPMELAVNQMQVDGNVMFTGVVRDITEKKRAEKLQQEFISTISHELRTPLTSIRGALGLLNSDEIMQNKETWQNLLNIARSNTSKLLYLINDLLDFQKIQAGKMQYNIEEFDLLELIFNTVQECKTYGEGRNINLTITDLSISTIITADKFRIAQVLSNLISNAVKFSQNNTSVEISALEKPDSVQISIKDYGKGIKPEHQKTIFAEFTQSDSSNTREFQGTGLGLSISKSIIEQHHGRIYFESEFGKGTTFHIELPKPGLKLAANNQ